MADSQRDEETGHRFTTFHMSEIHRRQAYEEEDKRWAFHLQLRDWLVIAGILVLDFGFAVAVAILEPGLGSVSV